MVTTFAVIIPLPFPFYVPDFGHHLFFKQTRRLGLRFAASLGGYGNLSGNAQLGGREIQSADDGIFVALRAGVNHTTQSAPDNHVAPGDDFCAGVDIADDGNVTVVLDVEARAQRAVYQDGSFPAQRGIGSWLRAFRVRLNEADG
jgi:hypothetical protein